MTSVTTPSLKQIALDHVEKRAFCVTPLRPGEKRPFLPAWEKRPASNRAEVDALWGEAAAILGPSADQCNTGVVTGTDYAGRGYLAVIDIDRKAHDGGESFATWCAERGVTVPDTMRVRTPTNGEHIYVLTPHLVRNRTAVLPGVDIRGVSGQVVSAGSVRPEGVYELVDDSEPAICPDGLLALFEEAKPREKAPEVDLSKIDQDAARKRALEWLNDHAPESIKGAGGNSTAYRVAARVRDFGVSEGDCFDLMVESSWYTRSPPGWNFDSLRQVVAHAFKYAQQAAGNAAPETMFSPVVAERPASTDAEVVQQPKRRKLADALLVQRDHAGRAAELQRLAKMEWLLDNVLAPGELSILYGQSHIGKSYLALDLTQHIARGAPWFGLDTKSTGVLYLALEGGNDGKWRMELHARDNADVPFALWAGSLNLFSSADDLRALVNLIRDAEPLLGARVGLLVVDTKSAATPGLDENAARDIGTFFGNLRKLIDAFPGLHILVVDHTGKDSQRGIRGSYKNYADADSVICVEKMPNKPRHGEWLAEKVRSGESDPNKKHGYRLESVTVGTFANGKPKNVARVVALDEADRRAAKVKRPKATSLEGRTLNVLLHFNPIKHVPPSAVERARGARFGVRLDDLRAEVASAVYAGDKNAQANAGKMVRHLTRRGLPDVWLVDDIVWVAEDRSASAGFRELPEPPKPGVRRASGRSK